MVLKWGVLDTTLQDLLMLVSVKKINFLLVLLHM